MKNFKNKIFAAVITSVIILSGTLCALAATPEPTTRPRPGSSSSTTETNTGSGSSETESSLSDTKNSESSQTATVVVTTAEPTAAPRAAAEKKYTTKGGAFGWFLLSVIVNSLLSFAIGNRFYKMSKKDSHITSEIRALRRDVEEKFASNIGGFSEPEVGIVNSNEDYSMSPDGLKPNTASSEDSEESAEEIFKRWENRLAEQRAERRAEIRASVKPRNTQKTKDFVEDDDSSVHIHSKSYQPRREMHYEEDSDDSYDEEESAIGSIKNKAKELITEIFPFKED